MSALSRFEGKVALVTGAASGIGEATALAFAGEGAAVVVADRQVEKGRAVVDRIREMGAPAAFAPCDVREETDVIRMVDLTVQTFGRLDCAYNNAGVISSVAPLADQSTEEWDEVTSINLRGVWLCMKYEIRQMLRQGAGMIVKCASTSGLIGVKGMSSYVAGKHGVVGLTKAAALDYAQQNIRINAVCPGAVLSDVAVQGLARMSEEDQARMNAAVVSQQPIGRWGRPAEIAEAVLWLCSPEASLMLGHAMVVDGAATID
jgi:NAD(P)-dependent dehydrogenase (short-subunit alcohol dehydrogenase family)